MSSKDKTPLGKGTPNGTVSSYREKLRQSMIALDRIHREHVVRKNYAGLQDWSDTEKSEREALLKSLREMERQLKLTDAAISVFRDQVLAEVLAEIEESQENHAKELGNESDES